MVIFQKKHVTQTELTWGITARENDKKMPVTTAEEALNISIKKGNSENDSDTCQDTWLLFIIHYV